ncbi:hypothetical protein ACJRO7_029193 [Eucalyptus globulus]|uniref:Uncharacterized protein n=1 Tax=Eucalyptus globulus TaxID=34317 RepID=A0ABD3K426_EUCGL
MSKPSSRLLQGVLTLHRLHHQLHLPKSSPAGAHSSSHLATAAIDPAAAAAGSSPPPSSLPRPFPLSYPSSSAAGSARNSCQSRAFGNLAASEVLPPRTGQAWSKSFSPAGLGPSRLNCYGVRHFSFQSSGNGGFAKKVFEKPTMSVLSTFSKYREAMGLQVESFLRSNYLVLVGAAAVLCALLWRIMFGIANTFVGISEGMAKYGFLALSSAIVAFARMVLKREGRGERCAGCPARNVVRYGAGRHSWRRRRLRMREEQQRGFSSVGNQERERERERERESESEEASGSPAAPKPLLTTPGCVLERATPALPAPGLCLVILASLAPKN